MRAEIAAIPDGALRVRGRDRERRGRSGRPYWIRVEVFVDGDEAIFDFRASDDQATGPCNTHLRRHRVGGVQRDAPPDEPGHPAQLRLLPADPDARAPRQRRERPAARARGRRQLGDLAEDRRPALRARSRRPCPIGCRRAPAAPAATSSSAACTRRPASTTPITTWRAAAGAGAATATATARRASSTGTAATRRSRCSRRGIPGGSGACASCRTPAGPDGHGAGWPRNGCSRSRADAIVVSEFADRSETRPWGLFGGLPGASAATLVRRAATSDGWRRSARRSEQRRTRSSRASCFDRVTRS